MTIFNRFIIALAFISALSACGQKTPLEVEKPQKVQEEISEPAV